ncbi:unnamed protein product [Urochloa humidicola]
MLLPPAPTLSSLPSKRARCSSSCTPAPVGGATRSVRASQYRRRWSSSRRDLLQPWFRGVQYRGRCHRLTHDPKIQGLPFHIRGWIWVRCRVLILSAYALPLTAPLIH